MLSLLNTCLLPVALSVPLLLLLILLLTRPGEDLPILAITGHDELQARVHDCQGLYGILRKRWNGRELLKRVATLAALPQAAATQLA